MDRSIELTTEQLFSIRRMEIQIEEMTPDQLKEHCLFLYKNYLQQQVAYQQLIAQSWGIIPSEAV